LDAPYLKCYLKKARRLNAWLVFLNESGFLMAPLVCRGWSLRGQAPLLLQRGEHQQKVSVIAVLCLRGRGVYFRLHPNADIHTQQVISFLRHMDRELNGPWLLLWDRLNAHRARQTMQFLPSRSDPRPYFLPAYAPDLNQIEYAWYYLKMNPLANSPHFDLPALTDTTRRQARAPQQKPDLLGSFLSHSPFFCSHDRTLLIQD
jgi:transposase